MSAECIPYEEFHKMYAVICTSPKAYLFFRVSSCNKRLLSQIDISKNQSLFIDKRVTIPPSSLIINTMLGNNRIQCIKEKRIGAD